MQSCSSSTHDLRLLTSNTHGWTATLFALIQLSDFTLKVMTGIIISILYDTLSAGVPTGTIPKKKIISEGIELYGIRNLESAGVQAG